MGRQAFCPRNTGSADAALAAFKGIPVGVSHFLPRGNSLWDLPMKLVCVESWCTRAERCCHATPSALSFRFADGDPEAWTGAATCLGHMQQSQGWEASGGSRTAPSPRQNCLPPRLLSPCGATLLNLSL